jgi:glucose-6-phosphate 1-dehydrogenase
MREENMSPEEVFGIREDEDMGTEDFCEMERTPEPCIIVIFGASGDLTYRKLLPALYNLFTQDGLPERYCVVGVGRTQMNDDAFRAKMRQGVTEAGHDLEHWEAFEACLYYQQLFYDDTESYKVLSSRLAELDRKHQTMENQIFNLAIPPSIYESVAGALGSAGLSREDQGKGNWRRLVVEKPFGYDLESARKLNRAIGAGFKEHQVFRIDHYMTKETVQNILIFRFANAIFEPIWNRNFIDHVRINASESLGVEHRASYYENSGVLRDMFQNHMMQLLSLVGAEPPSRFSADLVRDKKVELFRSLRPIPLEDLDNHLVLGQYTKGEIEGNKVPGYRGEPGVDPDSLTPT